MCRAACQEAIDCCPSPLACAPWSNFECEEGGCVDRGCLADDECMRSLTPAYRCIIDDVKQYGFCLVPCTDDADCEVDIVRDACVGTWGGESVCGPPPCRSDEECAADAVCELPIGQCFSRVCETDDDCEMGGRCDVLHNICACDTESPCVDGHACVPYS